MDVAALPVTSLKGVGPKLAEKLARLHINTVQDALFHLPFRYQDRTRIIPIGALRPGQEAVVRGIVELTDVVYRGRRSLVSRISDGTGSLSLRFFHFAGTHQARLERGQQVRCFGEVRAGAAGLEMIHPEYVLGASDESVLEDALTPIYPATEGVNQATLRKLIRTALDRHLSAVEEWLPEQGDRYSLQAALAYVHAPPLDAPLALLADGNHPAQRRLAFEELLAHHLSMRELRRETDRHAAVSVRHAGTLAQRLRAALPFRLTMAQERVIGEIVADLAQARPMQRLVQGDVGSGKTLVAAVAALHVVEAGLQVALMAPTELLAEQHFRNFSQWLAPLGIDVAWLSGKLGVKDRRARLAQVSTGEAAVVVGTHALFQGDVAFAKLGLIIVDEQHRFGVEQRLQLREKGSREDRYPHQLVMSATPIPRTLAQTLYADLDVSVIDELPPGRTPVETVVVPDTRRADVVQRVRQACLQGRQAYWVCPLIEDDGDERKTAALQLQAATETEVALHEALPELRVALVHGRMKSQEKERVMLSFKNGECDLLVATTVIEVGVDVPNASLMIIENAERLGLSQLHQLRGRVGRGSAASACVLMYRAPLSEAARERLACVRETNDGFAIAHKDLEMRGPGEMFGRRQTGLAALRVADLVRDQALLPDVARVAEYIGCERPDNVKLLIRRWLGDTENYGQV